MKDEWEEKFRNWKEGKKKKFEIVLDKPMNNKVRVKKAEPKKFLQKVIWIFPAIVVLYLVFANFIVTQNFKSFYDIGNEETYLTPADRISESFGSYKNLISGLVYFDVEMPRGAEEVTLRIRFKGDFPLDSTFSLGAKDQEDWHYLYKPIYSVAREELYRLKNNGEVYVVDWEKDLLDVEDLMKLENVVIATDREMSAEVNEVDGFVKEMRTIDLALRGKHEFYVYLEGDLDLEVMKEDINWYDGADDLIISLNDLEGNLIVEKIIEDDGVAIVDKRKSFVQTGEMKVENLNGIYKLKFSDFDGLIRRIKINSNKIVSENIFLASNEVYGVPTEESVLYFDLNREGSVKMITYHKEGLQRVRYSSNGVERVFDYDKEDEAEYLDLGSGRYEIEFPENDLKVSGVYFAFFEDGWFEPFKQRIVPIGNDFDWLVENVDYVVSDYNPVGDDDWKVAEVVFNVEEDNLVIKNGKLSMVFNTPHLSKEATKEKVVSIDWIKINVEKPGVLG